MKSLKIKKRHHLKKKELKRIIKELGEYSAIIPKGTVVEFVESKPYPLLLVNSEPLIMFIDGRPFLTLKGALRADIRSKYVVVDMGAVRFIANGADVMSPGIIDADPKIKEGELVIIVEERHKKPVSIGISLIDGVSMVKNEKGKAIKTIHYVGDKIWDLKP